MKIYISHGSVATYVTCGGIFNYHIIANCAPVCQWKFFKISQYLARFYGSQCAM